MTSLVPIGYLDRIRDRACKQRVIVTPYCGGSLTPIFPEQFNDVYVIFIFWDCKERWFTNPTAVVH